jgi:hypothetical protein
VDTQLDADAVETVRSWFEANEPAYREAGLIGPRVDLASDAPAQDQLLAMFGRAP